MKQTKPFNLPSNIPTCYVTPELMRQFDDELVEESWVRNFMSFDKLCKPRKSKYGRKAE
jgi:hypothetical protein